MVESLLRLSSLVAPFRPHNIPWPITRCEAERACRVVPFVSSIPTPYRRCSSLSRPSRVVVVLLVVVSSVSSAPLHSRPPPSVSDFSSPSCIHISLLVFAIARKVTCSPPIRLPPHRRTCTRGLIPAESSLTDLSLRRSTLDPSSVPLGTGRISKGWRFQPQNTTCPAIPAEGDK